MNNVNNTSTGAPYTGGDVIMVFFAVVMASFHVGQVGPAVTAFNKGRASARRIFEVREDRERDRQIEREREREREREGAGGAHLVESVPTVCVYVR
jgi:ABC-type multidrug transport system fused ATPase/permease subunit